ncbi:DUF3500 domain-containing protein [Paraburkholderia sp. J67]|uniref:DUF3500 domain-containing protein n=1 Tax=Paraburkholderia sp. J67 TaxID=2805435 RepID=UPI002ABE8AE1|nr:DUF3500 domain-containing protein [Paraburkholderia sp. J67]
MPVSHDYHDLLFPIDSPRLVSCRHKDAYQYASDIQGFHPQVAEIVAGWRAAYAQPFKGLTSDGNVMPGLYRLEDEGAPTHAMTEAANRLLSELSEAAREQLRYDVGASEWRIWSNPEFLVNPRGLRLEELPISQRRAVMALVAASLSPEGYRKAEGCMLTNGFLGELCGLPQIMNEWSYNFLLFGTPSPMQPWGWSLYGHHLCLNCFVLGGQMVISPTFMGAEPNVIDRGPHAGLALFTDEEHIGLELMRSLTSPQRERATVYRRMHDPAMPSGRWNIADQRHMGGAFQDNRIVPYEGVRASEFSKRQRERLLELVEQFIVYLPDGPRRARMRSIAASLDETWWSWIGGHGDDDAFYYRIQSPVAMIEFDHHSGVWLTNEEPARCHIHTVVRTPNGNDYGRDLLRQHYEQMHPGQCPGVECTAHRHQ